MHSQCVQSLHSDTTQGLAKIYVSVLLARWVAYQFSRAVLCPGCMQPLGRLHNSIPENLAFCTSNDSKTPACS